MVTSAVAACEGTRDEADAPLTRRTVSYSVVSRRAERPQRVALSSGDTLVVDQFLVTALSMTLQPCEDSAAPGETSALHWPAWLIGVAHAGHGMAADPSAVRGARAIDLLESSPRVLGSGRTGYRPYCGAHILIGPSGPTGVYQARSAPDMTRRSLWLEGRVLNAEGVLKRPVSVAARFSFGKTVALARAPHRFERNVQVVFHYDLRRALHRIDFGGLPPNELSRAVLRQLVDHQEIIVEES